MLISTLCLFSVTPKPSNFFSNAELLNVKHIINTLPSPFLSRDLNHSDSDSSLSMCQYSESQRGSSTALGNRSAFSRPNGGGNGSTDSPIFPKRTFGMEKCASLGEIHSQSSCLSSATSTRSLNTPPGDIDGRVGGKSSRGKKSPGEEDSASTGEDADVSSSSRKKHTFSRLFQKQKQKKQ